MSAMPKITEAEWAVMKVFWHKSPRTANEVVDALDGSGWNPKTIRTLIIRLQKKGALDFEKDGERCRLIIDQGGTFSSCSVQVQIWAQGRIPSIKPKTPRK